MRVLIFGTCYADSPEALLLLKRWVKLHKQLNYDCDLVLVDSQSPVDMTDIGVPVIHLEDNIGHLSRGGKDGWGRAFCAGLQYAIDSDYDYVVHLEGDSLFRLPVMTFCNHMQDCTSLALVTSVVGTKQVEKDWAETGIMFFDVEYLEESQFVDQYEWPDGASKKYPHTPEAVVWRLLDKERDWLPIKVIRDDLRILTADNVYEYDWITHTTPEIYEAFMRMAGAA